MMKNKPAYVFFINLFAIVTAFAQEQKQTISPANVSRDVDEVYYQHYGLRIGADLTKPIRSVLDKDYQGLELVGDYRINYRYYLAGEIGQERKAHYTDYFDYTTNGQYIRIGADYNSYNNWYGMENMIYFGGRYGFSTFSQEVTRYTVHTLHNYWGEPTEGTLPSLLTTYRGRTAHWIEALIGVKVELFKHFYAGASIRFSFLLYQKKDDFPNFWISGVQRVWEGSNFGINYNYTLSYMIPLYKKTKQKMYKMQEKIEKAP